MDLQFMYMFVSFIFHVLLFFCCERCCFSILLLILLPSYCVLYTQYFVHRNYFILLLYFNTKHTEHEKEDKHFWSSVISYIFPIYSSFFCFILSSDFDWKNDSVFFIFTSFLSLSVQFNVSNSVLLASLGLTTNL